MTALDIALNLIRRGIKPVPVPIGKNPTLPKWQKLVINAENAAQYFNGGNLNVGAQMGPMSNGLCDVDLDCAEAVALAPSFLPRTHSIFGRASKRKSHYLYIADDPGEKAVKKYNDEENEVIVELRLGGGGKGSQSVMPGSTHHDSGEQVEWDEDGEVARATRTELESACVKIAAGTLLLRHWPDELGRHDAALGVGGFLARAGWTPDDIHYFVETVCLNSPDGERWASDHARTAKESAEAHANGQDTRGFPWMVEFFGEKVARKIAKHVNYRGSDTITSAEGFEVDAATNRKIANSQHNIRNALELLEVHLRYDMFHDRMLISGLEGHDILNDAAMEKLWLVIDEQFRFRPSIDFFRIVVGDAARRNSFHPVRDYLDTLQWDGVKRIDTWLVEYCGANNTRYARAISAITLIAAVRRIRRPGCKFDEMLILESPQGTLKSELLAALAVRSDWFSDDLPLQADSKKVIEQTTGKWIIEAAEMSGMRRTDIEHLKAMLSRQFDRSRLAYARIAMEQPRQFIVVGTTNAAVYLKDLTGNRRFWPIMVTEIDLDAVKRDRDQLWAEASMREANGESIRLAPELWDEAALEQQERTVHEPWIDQIASVIGQREGKILNVDAWNIVGLEPGRQTQDHNVRLGVAMKALGFQRTLLRFDGQVSRCYVRGDGDAISLKRICVVRYSQREVYAYFEGENLPPERF
jgi:predicted P-loop ATPase